MTSKEKTKKVTAGAYNQFDTVSPATKLLEKRRKMYEVHQAFEMQKDQYKKDEETFKNKEEDIRKRDLEIQIQLVDFCQFLQENQIKRKKAQQKLKQEENLYNAKCNEIEILEKQYKQLTRHQKRFQTKVAALRKYEEYLDKVRSTYSDQYPEMSDILNRYQTLKKSNGDLIRERETMEANHAALKVQASNFQKQINQCILEVSNESKELSRKLQERINQRNELQADVEQTNELASKKNLNLGKILMAIDNLFFRCSEGSQRIKHQYEEHKADKKAQKKTGKISEQDKNKMKDANIEEEGNYEAKTKIAAQKLKSIFSYMKDFKSILDEYKKALIAAKKG